MRVISVQAFFSMLEKANIRVDSCKVDGMEMKWEDDDVEFVLEWHKSGIIPLIYMKAERI